MNQEKAIIKTKIYRERILQMSHDFYNTKKAFVTLITISVVFSIIQLILYSTGILEVGTTKIDIHSEDAWKGWTSLGLSGIGVIFQFIGSIYSMRFDRVKAVIFLPFGQLLIVLNAILMGLHLMALTFSLSIFIAISRFFIWGKSNDDSDKTTKAYWIGLSIFALVFVATFTPLYALDIIPFSANDTSLEFLKYVDILNSVLLLTGMFTFTMKSKWAFVIFGLSGITSILIMGLTHQIIILVSVVIFKFNDAVAFMAWSAKEENPAFVASGDL